jgi:GTP cyclohydrolase II
LSNIEISNIAKLPTTHGEFLIQSFKEGPKEHLAIFTDDILTSKQKNSINIRIHSECLTGDAIGSIKCDCQAQLNYSLDYISQNSGLVIYLRQEGRDIGLLNKVNAYALQDKGFDTIEANHQLGFKADQRTYDIVNFILEHFNIDSVNLLTNNPLKIDSLNIKVEKRLPIEVGKNPKNENYLNTKKEKMGHIIE